MSKFFKFLLMFLFIFSSFAQAITIRNSSNLIRINEVQNDDLYLAGNVVIIDSTINGNIFVLAKELYVNGTINGDINVLAQKVILNQKKCYSVRALARRLEVCGNTQRDLLLAVSELNIFKKNKVRGNILATATEAHLDGKIQGNVNIRTEKLKISELKVSGDLQYLATQATISDNLSVTGKIIVLDEQLKDKINKKIPWSRFLFNKIIGSLYSFLVAYIFGLIWVIFMPVQVSKIVRQTIKKPFQSFLLGLGIIIITPPLTILIAFTFIGLPFAVIGISALGVGVFMSKIFVAIIIGKCLLERFVYKTELSPTRKNKHFELLLGLPLLYLTDAIPYLGFAVKSIGTITTFGAFAKTRVDMYLDCREKEIF